MYLWFKMIGQRNLKLEKCWTKFHIFMGGGAPSCRPKQVQLAHIRYSKAHGLKCVDARVA